MKNKLYVLIDKNLDPIYGSVQGGHALLSAVMADNVLRCSTSNFYPCNFL